MLLFLSLGPGLQGVEPGGMLLADAGFDSGEVCDVV